jgi:fermentation-respiration switch protein FrsA (DUF1100 family)
VLRWVVLLSVTYVVVLVLMLFLENKLVYQPSPASEWEEPVDPRTTDVWLAADGQTVHAWWLPPARPDAGAVLVCHGNGGNLSHRGLMAADLNRTLGAGVLVFDYPGYGKSTGKPTEAGCYASAETAFRWLTDEAKIPPERVLLLGESLGGGPAVELATRHDCRALVLLYTFTSLPAAAKHHYRWLPTHRLMKNRFDNLAKIGQVKRPVFIAHGTADAVIPFRQSEALYDAANEPKELLTLDGYPHGLVDGEPFYTALARFLAERAPPARG